MKLKLGASLFWCGRCRSGYSNPLGHVCKVRNPRGKVTARPKLTLSAGDCTGCGKPLGNPFTHVCSNAGDFRKRRNKAAAAARRKKVNDRVAGVRKTERDRANARVAAVRAKHKAKGKAAPRKPAERHDYHACRDKDCARIACQAWKEGLAEGYEEGAEAGFERGYAAGMRAGASA